MSNTDSFIEEVTEEVRRDKLFAAFKKYGWIAALAIVAIVGGASFVEYRKAQAEAQAQALGDAMIEALGSSDSAARAVALAEVSPADPKAGAVLGMLTAAAQAEAEDIEGAVASLDAVAVAADVPDLYRQLARFKSLTLQAETMPAADRRQALEAMAQPGTPLRLLAEEQLALMDVAQSDTQSAIDRYQAILNDAEVNPDLQQRALQVIVALGVMRRTAGVAVKK